MTNAAITVVIPRLPPSANRLYRRTRGGGVAISHDVEAWRKEVWAEVRAAGVRRAPGGDLRVDVVIVASDARRRDVDNVIKATLDALALALDFDDARVVEVRARRERGDAARTIITLRPAM